MSYASMELRAERSLLNALGLEATLETYSGEIYNFDVLPVDNTSKIKGGDFISRDTEKTFEALVEDLPDNWRDGTLTVSGKRYFILDVTVDEYGQRAAIRVE